MTLAYVPPGVTIAELTSPSIAPLLAVPGSICLVGVSAGTITRTDTIQLTSTTPSVLPGVPLNATMVSGSIVSAIDAVNPSVAPNGFISGTDFTFVPATYTLTRIVSSNTLATGDPVTSGASTFTLASGAAPVTGRVVRFTNGSTTETATVLSVAGQVVTLASDLINSYTVAGTTVTWGTIPDGDSIYVTYTYTPSDYFQPIRLNSMTDIQQRFGNAWDPTSSFINCTLSFAAGMAFQNGASNVVLQPLFFVNQSTGALQQPTATQAATPSTWATVFNSLLSLDDINLLVPVIGQSDADVTDADEIQVFQAAQDFVYQNLNSENQYVCAILGEDSSGSSTEGQEATLIAHAQTLIPRYAAAVTQQLVFINTSQFSCSNATSSLLIGGQYVAAAVAGMLSARVPSATLTRQAVSGILAVTDLRSAAQKNNDAANGMMVVESKGSVVQVRHGITMDQTSVATRELNVVRAKQYIVESVSQTLDSQVIGKVVADGDASTLVNNVVIGALEDLSGANILSSYSGVQSQLTGVDPTTMNVQFTYQPIFVINYVNVQFSLDLTAQTITVDTSTTT